MYATTTRRDRVNPFQSTLENWSDVRRRAERAARRVARMKARQAPSYERYWGDPQIHGTGRQVNLRGGESRPVAVAPTRRSGSLPAMPRRSSDGLVAVGVGVTALAVVGWWLWRRERPAQVRGLVECPDWAM